jgi:hypothetical protein
MSFYLSCAIALLAVIALALKMPRAAR